MSDPISDHMHLWRVLYKASIRVNRDRCFADHEDAASYAYEKFTQKYKENSDQWTGLFAFVFGKFSAMHYFKRECNRERIRGDRVKEINREISPEPAKKARINSVKCLSEISTLMDGTITPRYQKYSDVFEKLTDLDPGAQKDKRKHFKTGNMGFTNKEAAEKVGLKSRPSLLRRIKNTRENPEARAIWSKYKEEAYS